jgi:hypothetical protein
MHPVIETLRLLALTLIASGEPKLAAMIMGIEIAFQAGKTDELFKLMDPYISRVLIPALEARKTFNNHHLN